MKESMLNSIFNVIYRGDYDIRPYNEPVEFDYDNIISASYDPSSNILKIHKDKDGDR